MTRFPFLFFCLISSFSLLAGCDDSDNKTEGSNNSSGMIGYYAPSGSYVPQKTLSGSYLAGHFAQSSYDWDHAEKFLNEVLLTDPKNVELQRRAIALALGSEQFEKAVRAARAVVQQDKQAPLPHILIALEYFKNGRYEDVAKETSGVQQDGVTQFMLPLMNAWSQAGMGKTDVADLGGNAVHIYQAILIADYRNDEEALKKLASRQFGTLALSIDSLEKIAEIYARHGIAAPARDIYSVLKSGLPSRAAEFQEKIDSIGKSRSGEPVKSPQIGLAQALFDMGQVLSEHYEDSARLFIQMAQYLNPNAPDTLMVLAEMSARHGQYDVAIDYLQRIDTTKSKEQEIRIRRSVAELLEEDGKIDQAVNVLSGLVEKYQDVETQIQIGDLYRHKEEYQEALAQYNKAFAMVKGDVPKKYWQLLYARGMTHERLKNWDLAEKDLKAALALQPDHPYVLNYLGYSWLDQGIHLEQATEMIAKAVSLRPDDGYIVDSLGWAHYRGGEYAEAVKTLEQAVSLLPNDSTVNDHLGDAYWQVGRKNEARFQWKRALSFTKEAELQKPLNDKIEKGIPRLPTKVVPPEKSLDKAEVPH